MKRFVQLLGLVGIGGALVSPVSANLSGQDALAALVNGEKVSQSDWLNRLKSLRAQSFISSTSPLRMRTLNAGELALESLINERLVMQYAGRTGLTATDAEVSAEMNRLKAQPNIAASIKAGSLSEEVLRKEVLTQRTLYNVATINQSITNEEVAAWYQKNQNRFGKPERFKFAMIRVSSDEQVKKVQDELAKGVPFGQVAALNSDDPITRKSGGELPLVTAEDTGIPAFIKDDVFKLKIGEVSKPLSSKTPPAAGMKPLIFIVRLLGKEDAVMPAYDSIKAQVERMALLDKIGGMSAADKKIDDFRKQSKVDILMPEYKDLFAKRDAPADPAAAGEGKP